MSENQEVKMFMQEAERMKPDGVKLVDAALKMFIEPNLNDYIKDLISVVTGKDECSHKAEVIQLVKNEFETYANRVLDAEMPTKSDKSSSILVDKELDDSRLYNLASLICMLISGISTSKDSSHIILATDLYQIGKNLPLFSHFIQPLIIYPSLRF